MKIGILLQNLFQPILGRVLSVARKILERPFLQLQSHFCHWSQHQKRRRNLHISCSLPCIHDFFFFWEWTCCSLKIFRLALVRQKCMTLQIWKESEIFEIIEKIPILKIRSFKIKRKPRYIYKLQLLWFEWKSLAWQFEPSNIT